MKLENTKNQARWNYSEDMQISGISTYTSGVKWLTTFKNTYVVTIAKTMAHKNDAGLTEEAPMLADAKEVRFVGRQTTLGTSEVNLSQSLTMTLYASDIPPTSVFIL